MGECGRPERWGGQPRVSARAAGALRGPETRSQGRASAEGRGGAGGTMGARAGATALMKACLVLAAVLGQVRARPRPGPGLACRLPGRAGCRWAG